MIDIRLPLLKKPKYWINYPRVNSDSHQNGYAPFGSLVTRNKKPYKTIQLPGPGQYNISKPIITPLFQTVKKKNNNIIVKINDVGSAVFKNEDDRFKNSSVDNHNNLGPGQYYSISLDQQASKHNNRKPNSLHYYKEKFKQVFNHQKNDTIPPLKILQRLQYGYVQSNGQMNTSNHNEKSKEKGPIWSKFTEQRFKQLPDNKVPGPGTYDNLVYEKKIKSKNLSSAFASESIRSFFDNIYFETNQETKALIRQKINFKSETPGPGSYNVNTLKKQSENKFQFFNSTEKRLQEDALINQLHEPQGKKMKYQLRESLKNLDELKKSKINILIKKNPKNRWNEQLDDNLLSIRNSRSILNEIQNNKIKIKENPEQQSK